MKRKYAKLLEDVRQHHKKAPMAVSEFMDDDLTIAVRLLEQGYTVSEVTEALQYTPFGKYIPGKNGTTDLRGLKIYINDILNKVNPEFLRKSRNSAKLCAQRYRQRAENFEKKYQEYSLADFGLYQDGKFALALVVDDSFALSTVLEVIKEHSPAKSRITEEYIAAIKESVNEKIKRYQAINSYRKNSMRDEADIYRKYAKRYKKAADISVLSAEDDQNIIRFICDDIIRRVYAGFSRAEQSKDFAAFVETRLKPLIYKGVKEASPIYCEAGRDKEKYLAGCLSAITMSYRAMLRNGAEEYSVAKDAYTKKIASITGRAQAYQNVYSQDFIDTLAAKDLLGQGHSLANTIKAISENTGFRPNQLYKQVGEYARIIVDCAARLLHAEKELLNYDPNEIFELEDKNVDLKVRNTYYSVMQERIRKTPSFQFDLSEPYAERDTVEEILHKNPDTDRSKLLKTLLEISPIAQFPRGENYLKRIFADVESRLRLVKEKAQEQDKTLQEYNKLRGLSTEGVYVDNQPLNELKDGRLAVKMLRCKVNADEVKQYIIALAKAAAITVPVVYAGTIVMQAQETLHREEIIRSFTGGGDTCADAYKAKARAMLQLEGQAQTATDVRITKDLIRENNFSKDEIEQTIKNNSPVSAESGRDEHYAEYVRVQAELEIEQENEKIKRYIPIGNINRSDDIKEEYAYQEQRVKEFLPTIAFDDLNMLIALNLMASQFTKAVIKAQMNAVGKDSHYGDFIVGKAEKFEKAREEVKEHTDGETVTVSKTLVRTLETNTEYGKGSE